AKLPANVDAVTSRHHPVENRQARGIRGLKRLARLTAIQAEHHLIAPFGEPSLEYPPGNRVVVGDQDAHARPSSPISLRAGVSAASSRSRSVKLCVMQSEAPCRPINSRRLAASATPAAHRFAAEPFNEWAACSRARKSSRATAARINVSISVACLRKMTASSASS